MIWKQPKQCIIVKGTCTLALCATRQLKRHSKLTTRNVKLKPLHFLIIFSYLARKGDFYDVFSDLQQDFIDQIEPLNIEARYPSYKERLLRSLTDAKCKEIIQETKKLQQWIKEKL